MKGLFLFGLLLVVAGFLLVFASLYMTPMTSIGEGGACIIIGFIPICFVGNISNWFLTASFIIILIFIILSFYIFWRIMRRFETIPP